MKQTRTTANNSKSELAQSLNIKYSLLQSASRNSTDKFVFGSMPTALLLQVAMGTMLLTAASSQADALSFTLQGSADQIDGFDSTHAGRAKNFFTQTNPSDEAIYTIASDWDAGHNPTSDQTWPTPDGIIGWATTTDLNEPNLGPQVVNSLGHAVYWDSINTEYVIDVDGTAASNGYSKLYYLNNQQSIGTLSLGNNGTPNGSQNDRENVALSQYKMDRVYSQGGSAYYLSSATFTIHIDDVINMDLVSTDGVLPSQAFVNVYEGDGNLVDYNSVQNGLNQSDTNTADRTVDLNYFDQALEQHFRISDWALTRNFVLNGESTLQFDFDITEAVRQLMKDGADFTAISLGSSSDGDFTLASLDRVVTENDDILENLLPYLTLTFDETKTGDYNLNGEIDQGDYSVWADALISGEDAETAGHWIDGNDNGTIDQGDFSIWADAYLAAHHNSEQAALLVADLSNSVPEPSGLLMLGLTVMNMSRRQRNLS